MPALDCGSPQNRGGGLLPRAKREHANPIRRGTRNISRTDAGRSLNAGVAGRTRTPDGRWRRSRMQTVVRKASERPGQTSAGNKSRLPRLEPAGFAVALDRCQISLGGLFHLLRRHTIFFKRRNRPDEKAPDCFLHRRRGIFESPGLHLRVHNAAQWFGKGDVLLAAHGMMVTQRTEESTAKRWGPKPRFSVRPG